MSLPKKDIKRYSETASKDSMKVSKLNYTVDVVQKYGCPRMLLTVSPSNSTCLQCYQIILRF